NFSSALPWFSMDSTSRPMAVSAVPISSVEAVVSRCSRSQSRVNFMACLLSEIGCAAGDRRQGTGKLEQFHQHIGEAAGVVDGAVGMGNVTVELRRQLAHAPVEIAGAAQRAGHGVEADAAATENLARLERTAEHAGAGKLVEIVVHPQPVED